MARVETGIPNRVTAAAATASSMAASASASTASMARQKAWLVNAVAGMPHARRSHVLSYHAPIWALLRGATTRFNAARTR